MGMMDQASVMEVETWTLVLERTLVGANIPSMLGILFHSNGLGGDRLKKIDSSSAGNSGSSNKIPSSKQRFFISSYLWLFNPLGWGCRAENFWGSQSQRDYQLRP
jgi:hypothetical protein